MIILNSSASCVVTLTGSGGRSRSCYVILLIRAYIQVTDGVGGHAVSDM